MKRFKITSVLICLLLVVPCMGATIIVDANTANPSADFNNIKDAISSPATTDGDIIVVNPGIYTGADNRDLDFSGKAITLMSTNPNDPDIVATTIIDCEDLGRGFFFHYGEDANSIVDGFTITNGKGDLGGGMQIENSSPTVRNCIFSANIANYVGGGMYNYNSSPTVKNCLFIGNSSARGGAGMYNYINSSPTVSDCTFINNSAYTTATAVCSGGGIHNRSSSPTITNCKFIGNTAKQDGGGIYNQTSSHPNIINCTFINNSGRSGGGIYNNQSNPKIVNCTFSKNSTNLYNPGGAICNSASSPEIVNCIIWDNKGTSPSEIYPTTLPTVSYCDVKGGYPGGTNIINLDPLFVDPNSGDYRLLPDSPCIDAGKNTAVPADTTDLDGDGNTTEPIPWDLDGNPRIVDGNNDGIPVVDMGAYEAVYINTAPVACIVGGDRTVEAGSYCEARVTLDGSCSSDGDSTPGTNDDINDFDWYEVIDACDPNSDIFLGSGEIIECNLPLGEHDIILEVTDKAGAFDANEVTITVEDTTPLEFSLSVAPDVLWLANHTMVLITPTLTVSDNCDESPEVMLVSITSSEDDDAKGDGHTSDDIQISANGSIYLRAERSGTGTGRVYTITYQAVDDSGNITVRSVTVTVPHDRR